MQAPTIGVTQNTKAFIVRLYDGMDMEWIDVSDRVSREEAERIWNEYTKNGTEKTKYDDIDYYAICDADVVMRWSQEGRQKSQRKPSTPTQGLPFTVEIPHTNERVTFYPVQGDINNLRQNHPELIARDLSPLVPRSLVREVLKSRGVNKWFRVRRLLIQLKTRWRERVKELEDYKKTVLKGSKEYFKLVGYIEALIDCRQQVRALCHSPRDIGFPDNPRDFGEKCILPENFPTRPHKRWLWTH